jgi:antitoxin component of MazEF toxin-antitoxin module
MAVRSNKQIKKSPQKAAVVKNAKSTAITGNQTNGKTKRKFGKNQPFLPQFAEAVASYTTRIRPIGNSRGLILNNHIMEAAGIKEEAEVVINATHGVIYITEIKSTSVNTDLSTWDSQFKSAIKKGALPERDMFEHVQNQFDQKEWK